MCEGCICIDCAIYNTEDCYYYGKNDFLDYYKKVQLDKQKKLTEVKRMLRIKVCWKHKVFYPIYPDHYESTKRLKIFEGKHRGCCVQVANLDELEKKKFTDPIYECAIIEA